MKIYVYSDESGVFDHKDKYFVYGGLIFLDYNAVENCARLFSSVENIVRLTNDLSKNDEVKAATVSNKTKNAVFRSLGRFYKFGCVIEQSKIYQEIWYDKKSKQRYLDFAYKMALKNAFQRMRRSGLINIADVSNIAVYVDEHSTATNGRYTLEETLDQEFKTGMFNFNYSRWYSPLFPKLQAVRVNFLDSKSQRMIRAADFVANKIYYFANADKWDELGRVRNLYLTEQPKNIHF